MFESNFRKEIIYIENIKDNIRVEILSLGFQGVIFEEI